MAKRLRDQPTQRLHNLIKKDWRPKTFFQQALLWRPIKPASVTWIAQENRADFIVLDNSNPLFAGK